MINRIILITVIGLFCSQGFATNETVTTDWSDNPGSISSDSPVPFGWHEFTSAEGHYILLNLSDTFNSNIVTEYFESILYSDESIIVGDITDENLSVLTSRGAHYQVLTWFEYTQLCSSTRALGSVYELTREHPPFVLAGENIDFHITFNNNTTDTHNYLCYLWYNSPTGYIYIGADTENDVTGGSNFTIDYITPLPSGDYPKSYIYNIYEDGTYVTGANLYVNKYNQPQTSFEVAIICTESLYSTVSSKLDTYSSILSNDYSCNVNIYHNNYTPASLRNQITSLWSGSPSVEMVILVGSMPFPSWEFPWGEHCPLISFYSELDGSFTDTDSDGYYDYHNWGSAGNGPDIGLFMMRPPDGYESYTSAYLDRIIDFHNNGGQSLPGKGIICRNHDWWAGINDPRPAFKSIFGISDVDYLGGWDAYVSGQSWLNILSAGYLLADIWVHSAPYFHQFDINPHQNVFTSEVAAIPEGVRFISLSGCHACDFIEQPVNCFATNGYLNHNKGLALIGPVRSIGVTCSANIFNALAYGKTIGEAIDEQFSYMYTRDYVDTYTSDNPENFIWEYGMFGDPFITFAEDTVSIEDNPDDITPIHSGLVLSVVYPNPVSVTAIVGFSLPESSTAELAVYDITGRRIRVLVDGVISAGMHSTVWQPDATITNGVYFIRLSTAEGTVTRHVLVIR